MERVGGARMRDGQRLVGEKLVREKFVDESWCVGG